MQLQQALDQARHAAASGHTIVLVEGESDVAALRVLAGRRGTDLPARGIRLVAMSGATNIRRFVEALDGARLAGLCDEAEAPLFQRGLRQDDLEAHGFFVCVPDLEGELIRAVGVDGVLAVADAEGELHAFRTLQRQPEWRDRPVDAQLRRWIASRARRKLRYAGLLAGAVDLARAPAPLIRLLDHVG